MKKIKFLFEIAHPKHFYQFMHVIEELKKENEVMVIARDKDVVFQLLEEFGISYVKYGKHGKSLPGKLLLLPQIFFSYFRIVRQFKPDFIISKSSPYATIVSKFNKCKSIIFPDAEIVALTNHLAAPLSYGVITPNNYPLNYGKKHKRVSSFFESAYLHPRYFTPDPMIYDFLKIKKNERFVLLRFIGWYASHDRNKEGLSNKEKEEIVDKVSKFAAVFISSEGELPESISKYQLKIPVSKIHHVLYYSSLYIGDSQTMATEAALLGTPSIRINSFVGENDMSNFKTLENDFKLLFNYEDHSRVIKKALEILKDKTSKKEWQKKREEFFEKVEDINFQIVEILKTFL